MAASSSKRGDGFPLTSVDRLRWRKPTKTVETTHSRSHSHADDHVLRLPVECLPSGAVLRLYGAPKCPYAQRVRLVLHAKNIAYDLVNIDVDNKPDWLIDISFYGDVPVIIHNGRNIYESVICCEYLEEAFPKHRLYSPCIYQRAMGRVYHSHWAKHGIPAFDSLLRAGRLDTPLVDRLELQLGHMENFLDAAQTPFFSGPAVGFSDYMIWPWFERIPLLGRITHYAMSCLSFPLMTAWMARMWQDKPVRFCRVDNLVYLGYVTPSAVSDVSELTDLTPETPATPVSDVSELTDLTPETPATPEPEALEKNPDGIGDAKNHSQQM